MHQAKDKLNRANFNCVSNLPPKYQIWNDDNVNLVILTSLSQEWAAAPQTSSENEHVNSLKRITEQMTDTKLYPGTSMHLKAKLSTQARFLLPWSNINIARIALHTGMFTIIHSFTCLAGLDPMM